jgi:DNA repair protein RadC
MPIHDWPENLRPRERLLKHGAAALGDAELLALFLRIGTTRMNAVELGRHLLAHFGSLTRLCHASLTELSAIPGIGVAKYAQLQAVMEMARRALAEELTVTPAMQSSRAVGDYLRLTLGPQSREVFRCLFLDIQNRLIADEEMFQGTIDQAVVYPREVIRKALAHNAASVILAHNHPTGLPEPSEADLVLTATLVNSLALIDVRVLDHIVVAAQTSFSFADHGLLPAPALAPQHIQGTVKKSVDSVDSVEHSGL